MIFFFFIKPIPLLFYLKILKNRKFSLSFSSDMKQNGQNAQRYVMQGNTDNINADG